MNRTTLQSLLILPLMIVLIGAPRPGSAVTPESGPSASGQGFFNYLRPPQGLPQMYFFSFHAKEHKNGDDKGRARFINLTDGTRVDLKVNCLVAGGNVAVMSGVVTRSNDPALPEGVAAVFAVLDWNAAGGNRPDEITPLFPITTFPEGKDCNDLAPLTILPVIQGDIRIRP